MPKRKHFFFQEGFPYILNLQHFDQYKNSFWFHVTGMLSHPWQHVLSVLERCVILLLAPQNQPNQQQQPHNNLQLDMVQLRRGTCGFIVVGFLNPSSSPVNALRLRVFFFRSARTSQSDPARPSARPSTRKVFISVIFNRHKGTATKALPTNIPQTIFRQESFVSLDGSNTLVMPTQLLL